LGGFALQIDSNKDMVGYLAMMAFYDLPTDWLQTFPKQIEVLTLDQVQKVAQAYLKPDSWVGVLLGKQSEQNPINAMPVPLPKMEQSAHH
jgi:zinc protease